MSDSTSSSGNGNQNNQPSKQYEPERTQQLTVYISETDHFERKPLYLKILELVKAQNGAGATVLKGLAGYSASSRSIQTSGFADLQQKLPLIIVIVDATWRIQSMLPQLEMMVRPNGGLITVQDLEAHRFLHPNLPRGAQGHLVRVGDIMVRHVVTVHPDTPAADVVPKLLGKFYKSLPVVDRDNKPIGMISDGDLIEKGKLPFSFSILEALEASGERGYQEILEDLRASKKRAGDLMSTGPLVTVAPDALALEAARLMLSHSIRSLPVVDPSGHLIGIIGRLDILKAAGAIFPQAQLDGEDTASAPTHHAMRLGDILDPEVPVVSAETHLHDVVETLVTPPCPRRLIVIDNTEDRRVMGIVTDRDLVLRAHSQARPTLLTMLSASLPFKMQPPEHGVASAPMQERTAAEVMSTNMVTAPEAMPLGEAIRVLVQREINLLPVLDKSGRLLGVVTRNGVLQTLVDNYGGA